MKRSVVYWTINRVHAQETAFYYFCVLKCFGGEKMCKSSETERGKKKQKKKKLEKLENNIKCNLELMLVWLWHYYLLLPWVGRYKVSFMLCKNGFCGPSLISFSSSCLSVGISFAEVISSFVPSLEKLCSLYNTVQNAILWRTGILFMLLVCVINIED